MGRTAMSALFLAVLNRAIAAGLVLGLTTAFFI